MSRTRAITFHDGMSAKQAYQLGYDVGYNKGCIKSSRDYRRVCKMLAEEKEINARLWKQINPNA